MIGTVTKWISERGFGFIKSPGFKNDIFVHHTGIDGEGRKDLSEGDQVSFETVPGSEKGPRAVNVRVV